MSITCPQFFVTRLSTSALDNVDRTQMRVPKSFSPGTSRHWRHVLVDDEEVISGLGKGGADPPHGCIQETYGKCWGTPCGRPFGGFLTMFLQPAQGSDGMGHGLVEPSTPSIASRRARLKKMPATCGSRRHESSNRQTILHRDMTKKSSFATKYEFERALYCGVWNARHPHLAGKTR